MRKMSPMGTKEKAQNLPTQSRLTIKEEERKKKSTLHHNRKCKWKIWRVAGGARGSENRFSPRKRDRIPLTCESTLHVKAVRLLLPVLYDRTARTCTSSNSIVKLDLKYGTCRSRSSTSRSTRGSVHVDPFD